jgi:hypothetical protein
MAEQAQDRAAEAARWLAEAVETGNPLAPLPEAVAPRDVAEAEEAAAAVLEALDIAPCGLRVLRRPGAPPLVGPMIEGRLVPGGAEVALVTLRHPRVSAAVVGVLADALDPGSDAPPAFSRLHPAIDISATRFTEDTADTLALTADLARVGLVVAGKGRAARPGVSAPRSARRSRSGAGWRSIWPRPSPKRPQRRAVSAGFPPGRCWSRPG